MTQVAGCLLLSGLDGKEQPFYVVEDSGSGVENSRRTSVVRSARYRSHAVLVDEGACRGTAG